MPDIRDEIYEYFQHASDWYCECGAQCDPCSADWRWSGERWEHHHPYPMGHVPATRLSNEKCPPVVEARP